MRKALIWDLDGTLLDSYEIIVSSLRETLAEIGIDMKENDILNYVITYSVSAFINYIADEFEQSAEDIKKRYSEISGVRNLQIKTIPNALEILQATRDKGFANFVYTHKGKSTEEVLVNLKMKDFFEEIVTSQNGFARKPSPDAINYLVEKYRLCRENTFYVGDRSIDVECAVNAGVKSILFLAEGCCGKATGKEDFVVRDLMGIRKVICN